MQASQQIRRVPSENGDKHSHTSHTHTDAHYQRSKQKGLFAQLYTIVMQKIMVINQILHTHYTKCILGPFNQFGWAPSGSAGVIGFLGTLNYALPHFISRLSGKPSLEAMGKSPNGWCQAV